MSFTESTFRFHAKIQKYIPLPYYLDIELKYLKDSPIYNFKCYKTFRWSMYLFTGVLFPYFILRLIYIYSQWDSLHQKPFEEVAWNGICTCAFANWNSTNRLVCTKNQSLQLLITECCKLRKFSSTIRQKSDKLSERYSLNQSMVWAMASVAPMISLCWFATSFATSWCPMQVCFEQVHLLKYLHPLSTV